MGATGLLIDSIELHMSTLIDLIRVKFLPKSPNTFSNLLAIQT